MRTYPGSIMASAIVSSGDCRLSLSLQQETVDSSLALNCSLIEKETRINISNSITLKSSPLILSLDHSSHRRECLRLDFDRKLRRLAHLPRTTRIWFYQRSWPPYRSTLETSAFAIPVRGPIYVINSVDKIKFSCTTAPPPPPPPTDAAP